MKSISEMIKRGLASGKIKSTPEVLEILKDLNRRRSSNADSTDDTSKSSKDEPAGKHSRRRAKTEATGKPGPGCNALVLHTRPVFVSSLPGRVVRCTPLLIACLLVLGTCLDSPAFAASSFESGNAAFASGNYAEAQHNYESVIKQHGFSAPLLFNLGNASLRAGQTGQAILDYERAHWLAPNDVAITKNLSLARQQADLAPEPVSRLQSAARVFTFNTWSCLAVVSLLFLAASLLLQRVFLLSRLLMCWAKICAAVVLATAIAAVTLRWSDLNRAVVTAPEAPMRISPVTVVQPLFTVRQGEIVSVKQTHGDFALVHDQQGHQGWVSRDAITLVIPSRGQS